ncbi:MAG: hypothetical protein HY744_17500 [Deltaproteobacteria bacterium]|nr:hypothetical protein [Deltaproteobacteria bacterium]
MDKPEAPPAGQAGAREPSARPVEPRSAARALSDLVLCQDGAIEKYRRRHLGPTSTLDVARLERARAVLLELGRIVLAGSDDDWERIEAAWSLLGGRTPGSVPAAPAVPAAASPAAPPLPPVAVDVPPAPPAGPRPPPPARGARVMGGPAVPGRAREPAAPGPVAADQGGTLPPAQRSPFAEGVLPFVSDHAASPPPAVPARVAPPAAAPGGDETAPISQTGLVVARLRPALPFEPAPPGAGPAPGAARSGPAGAPALPFDLVGRPASPVAPGSPEDDTPPALTLEQYASLCAEHAAYPDREAQIETRYQIRDRPGRARLDRHWQERFAREPALRSEWERLRAQYQAWLTQQGR